MRQVRNVITPVLTIGRGVHVARVVQRSAIGATNPET
jgi:hypothetical protein